MPKNPKPTVIPGDPFEQAQSLGDSIFSRKGAGLRGSPITWDQKKSRFLNIAYLSKELRAPPPKEKRLKKNRLRILKNKSSNDQIKVCSTSGTLNPKPLKPKPFNTSSPGWNTACLHPNTPIRDLGF